MLNQIARSVSSLSAVALPCGESVVRVCCALMTWERKPDLSPVLLLSVCSLMFALNLNRPGLGPRSAVPC